MKDTMKLVSKTASKVFKGKRDSVKRKGVAEICTIGSDGKTKQRTIVENLVTEVGDAHVADQMAEQDEAAMGWMGFGTGTGQDANDTTLATETDRNALTTGPTQGAGAQDNDVVYVGQITGVTGTFTEAGIFNNASIDTGTMFTYTTFSHTLSTLDTLQITWTVSFGD